MTIHSGAVGISLYIHWPFCLSKCPYCDFNSHVVQKIDHVQWRNALVTELKSLSKGLEGRRLKSIFFGGGTPSLMDPETVSVLLGEAKKIWGTETNLEVSMEANPSSVESQSLRLFNDAGINRLSLGVQSFDDKALRFLGREHSAADAIEAIETAKRSFDHISFDLIYARPEQTLSQWIAELDIAIRFETEHISAYQLTIERGTAFFRQHRKGEFSVPDNDKTALFYEATIDKLAEVGLFNYEISNHARPGAECLHNLRYWRMDDYLGIGPGAHSRISDKTGEHWAISTHRAPTVWLAKVEEYGNAITEKNSLCAYEKIIETLAMGLRLEEGISIKKLTTISKKAFSELFSREALEPLIDEGLIEFNAKTIKATRSGRMRLNGVLDFLIKDISLDC